MCNELFWQFNPMCCIFQLLKIIHTVCSVAWQVFFHYTENTPRGKHRALLHEAEAHVLTFSDGERRVSEVESYQLSGELAKEVAGHGAIEEGALIAHSIHQCDGLGGIGRAHDLNDTGAKGKETCQIRWGSVSWRQRKGPSNRSCGLRRKGSGETAKRKKEL